MSARPITRLLLAFSVVVFALAGSVSMAAARPVSEGVAVTSAPNYRDNDPDIAVDSANHVHIVWQRQGDGQGIWYATNKTGSWVTEQVTSGQNDHFPKVGLDSAGHAYIAYVRTYLAVDSGIFTSTNASGHWVTARFVSDGDIDEGIGLAVAPNGALHIVWHGSRTGAPAFQYATNVSGKVVATKLMEALTSSAPSIARAANGKIHIVVSRTNPPNGPHDYAGLYYFTDAAGSLATSGVAITRSASTVYPIMTVDAANKPRVVYFEEAEGAPDLYGVRVLKQMTYAGYLQHDGQLSYGAPSVTAERAAPAASVEGNGEIHAAWLQYPISGRLDVYVTTANGDDTSARSTDAATNVATDGKSSVAIALDSSGNDHVVFTDPNTGSGIYYVTSTPADARPTPAATWSSPVDVSASNPAELTAPIHAPRLGQSVATNGDVPTAVTWSTGDEVIGITGYQLQRKTGTGSFADVPIAPGPEEADLLLHPGSTYTFQVRAHHGGTDGDWSIGPSAQLTVLQESKAKYGKTWSTVKASSASGGTVRRTSTKNASATFTFTGRSAALVAPKGAAYGRVKVVVDGVTEGFVDMHGPTQARAIVWARTWATSDPHIVKFIVEATSGHARVDIDALVIDK